MVKVVVGGIIDVDKREMFKQTALTNLYRISIFPIAHPKQQTHNLLLFQNVHLHEDQLETVMSVLEESNVEIRHNLHDLLSSCQLNSQVSSKPSHEMTDFLEILVSWF